MLMIKDGENDTILISEEQLVSIYKQLKGVWVCGLQLLFFS
jgi:hypothetical protein